MKIQRSWVAGVEDEVKTLYSKKWMPVDPILAELLLELKGRTATPAKDTDWVFVNPETGKPYWPGRLQEHHLIPAGEAAKIGRIGWHTFRHYLPFLTMSSDSGGRPFKSEYSHQDVGSANVSPDIVFSTLEAVEEPEELIAGVITCRTAIRRCCLGESLLLHRQRRL